MRRHSFVFLVLTALACGLLPESASAQGEPKPAALHAALDDFKTALDERWSYRHANGADFDAAIATLRKKIDAGISTDEFGLELHKIVALGIDGHSGVSGYKLPGGGYLPFLIEPEWERFVAFSPERTAFLADGWPYVTKIDGRDVADWCRAAAALVPKGSPQYVRHRCLARLRDLDYLRGSMSLPKRDAVDVELATGDGTARRTMTLRVASSSPAYGTWPRGGSRLLDGNVGYLRLANMVKATSVQEIKEWMPKFRDTTGLVVDVRDNNGGDRDALRLLYSYLAAPGDPPRVFTAAAYRLHNAHKEDHLAESHFMFRVGARRWTDEERRAIAEFAKTFKPEWELPKGQFSDWHYMVLGRLNDPGIFHYEKPVVVLMNAKCFSATDIFLAGLKGMKNVTLLGTPSSGGSANTQEITLGATPLRVRLGSMASFQTDGKLFDGHGVHPDVVLEATPQYYIGGEDNVLAEAVKLASRVRSLAADALRLMPIACGVAATREQADPLSNWSRLFTVTPGAEIVVEARGSPPFAGHVVRAGESELIVLDLSGSQVPRELRRALLAVASAHPESFPLVPGAAPLVHGDVRAAVEGVYLRGRRVADTDAVVKHISRPDIVRITIVGAVLGAGAGFFVGYVSAVGLAFKDCGGDCTDEKVLIGLSVVGLPILGGTLGYYVGRRASEDVIYRAP
jgi:hypothetical protein